MVSKMGLSSLPEKLSSPIDMQAVEPMLTSQTVGNCVQNLSTMSTNDIQVVTSLLTSLMQDNISKLSSSVSNQGSTELLSTLLKTEIDVGILSTSLDNNNSTAVESLSDDENQQRIDIQAVIIAET
jgi:hypothetical protein